MKYHEPKRSTDYLINHFISMKTYWPTFARPWKRAVICRRPGMPAWQHCRPIKKELLSQLTNAGQTIDVTSYLPAFEPDEKGVATRKASRLVLDAIAPHIPGVMGGSADLSASNLTDFSGHEVFSAQKSDRQLSELRNQRARDGCTDEWHGAAR